MSYCLTAAPLAVTGLLLLAATPGVGYAHLVLPLLIAGVGVSMAFTTTPTAALSTVAPPDMGKASGATNTLQRFGQTAATLRPDRRIALAGTLQRRARAFVLPRSLPRYHAVPNPA